MSITRFWGYFFMFLVFFSIFFISLTTICSWSNENIGGYNGNYILTSDFKIEDSIEDFGYLATTSSEKIAESNDDFVFFSDGTSAGTDKQILCNTRPIIIDAGHGGKDPGTSSGKTYEKDISLDVALKVNALLLKKGLNTYLTRINDSFLDLNERINIANNANGILFVSIHCNAHENTHYCGTVSLYSLQYDPKFGVFSKKLASALQKQLSVRLETADKGILERDDLSVLKHPQMPSTIVELGFISNPYDIELLNSDSFRKKAAVSIANGIEDYLRENINSDQH